MTWRYQLVRKLQEDGEISFGVHEAYLNDDNTIHSITVNPIQLQFESLYDLINTVDLIRKDIKNNGCINYEDVGIDEYVEVDPMDYDDYSEEFIKDTFDLLK